MFCERTLLEPGGSSIHPYGSLLAPEGGGFFFFFSFVSGRSSSFVGEGFLFFLLCLLSLLGNDFDLGGAFLVVGATE